MKKHSKLFVWRKQIDAIDESLLSLLAKRVTVVKKIAAYKKKNGLPILDQKRWNTILDSQMKKAEFLGLQPTVIQKIWDTIHAYSQTIEEENI